MNCLSEAVTPGSEMRARQFEVGNERCPFSFQRRGDLGLWDAATPPPPPPPSYVNRLRCVSATPSVQLSLAVNSEE